jgi:hypothetical protein
MNRLLPTLACLAALLLAAGCCEPLPPKPTTPEPPEPVLDELPDELQGAAEPVGLVLLPSDASKTVSLRFVFATGSAEDPPDWPRAGPSR